MWEQSEADATRARADLANLPKEDLGADQLGRLEAETSGGAKKQEEADTRTMGGKPSCFSVCRLRREEAKRYLTRLGVAKRRDELRLEITKADAKTEHGRTVVSGLATEIASLAFAKSRGWTEERAAWAIAWIGVVFRILLATVASFLSGHAFASVSEGWARRPWRKPEAPAPKPARARKPKPAEARAQGPAPKKRCRKKDHTQTTAKVSSISPEKRTEVYRLLDAGLSCRAVAAQTGVAKSTVQTWKNERPQKAEAFA
jgi:hypothetical protein